MDINKHRRAKDYAEALRVKALARFKGQPASSFVRELYGPQHPVTNLVERSAITTGDIDADVDAAQRAFLELLRHRSPTGVISGWRRVLFQSETLVQTTPSEANWTPESGIKLPSKPEFDTARLERRKLTSLVPATREAVEAGGSEFRNGLERDLVSSISLTAWQSMFDPASAAIAGERPASLTNGVTPVAATGVPADDIAALIDSAANTMNIEDAYLIWTPANQFKALAEIEIAAFTGINFAASSGVPDDVVVLFDPSRVLLAEDAPELLVSTQSTLLFEGETEPVSLWQTNTAAFVGEQFLNFEAAPGAVAFLSGVNW